MDVSKIREDFPLLKNRDIIYLDNAATSQKPAAVLDAEKRFMRNTMQTRSAVSMS